MIQYLECFTKVASLKSFSKAAHELRISQPAVSRQIKLLEDGLEQKLFVRSTQHVELTREGKEFLEQIRPSFDHLEKILSTDQNPDEFKAGTIIIGCLGALGPFMDHSLDFLKEFPDCDIRLEYMANDELIQSLKNDWIDLAIGIRVPKNEETKAYKLGASEATLYTRPGNPLLRTPLNELESLPMIRYRFPSHFHTDPQSLVMPYLRKFKRRLGIKDFRFKFAVNSHHEVRRALLRTNYFAVCPNFVVASEVKRGRLIAVCDYSVKSNFYLYHLHNEYMKPRVRAFKQHLLSCYS